MTTVARIKLVAASQVITMEYVVEDADVFTTDDGRVMRPDVVEVRFYADVADGGKPRFSRLTVSGPWLRVDGQPRASGQRVRETWWHADQVPEWLRHLTGPATTVIGAGRGQVGDE